MSPTNPILVVDLSYIETLLVSRNKSKRSNPCSNKDRFSKWLISCFKTVAPSGVIFIAETETPEIISLELQVPVIYGSIKNTIYTVLVKNKLQHPICILSNSLELWALSSTAAKVSFLAIDSNNRVMYYNNTTGLDIISRFIGTYKIINKLGLDSLKFLNLQYLYLLLFYIQFTTKKTTEDFYFDGTFFRNKKAAFLKSKGTGLDLITKAHKFLSYAFLTKNEFMDYFLLGSFGHYSVNLQRLPKLMYLDIQILEAMKHAYDRNYMPVMTPDIEISDYRPDLSHIALTYTTPSTNCSLMDKSVQEITKKLLGNNSKVPLKTGIPNSSFDDTNISSDIDDYVSNLLLGL